jgi:formate dehydrogenase beta subunit
MGISRRAALKGILVAGSTAVAGTARTDAATVRAPLPDAVGLLYDATRCIGCKACVVACAEANGLAPDTADSHGMYQQPVALNEHTKNIIKLYYRDEPGPEGPRRVEQSFMKQQCMHCVDPACVNACMLGALHKAEHGIVAYNADLCIGCRYCQVACPFNIPKYEWSKTIGQIVKCELCRHRLANNQIPACAEVCPRGAVIYGNRADLLADAKRRIAENPGLYVDKVYGEHDAGGTQCLYLSHVDFDKLGLPDIGDGSVPAPQRDLQHALYKNFAAPVALYGVLAAVMLRNRRSDGAGHDTDGQGGAA